VHATSLAPPPVTPSRPYSAAALLVLVSALAGTLLGVADLAAQKELPYPWADLANSSAVWAVAAFGIGCWANRTYWRGAVAGVILLVVAVEAYYLAAVFWQGDSTASLTSPVTQVWLAFGVFGGALFGAAGAAARGSHLGPAAIGTALAGSVLYAESLVLLNARPDQPADRVQTAVLEAALGVVIVLVAGTSNQRRALALLACVPLTALGYVAFSAMGLAG
jgi:uncharacterized protein DUF6518